MPSRFVYELPDEFKGFDYLVNHYHAGERDKGVQACKNSYYSSELFIHDYLTKSDHHTLDIDEAQLFYIPILSGCEYFDLGHRKVAADEALGNQIQDRFAKAFSYLEKNYRTFPPNKRNHFLVTSHPDVGTDFRKTFPKEAKNILRVMRAVNPFHCDDPKIEDDIIISSYFHRNAPPASMNNQLGFRRNISK
jgi:hypothetical protein